MEKQLIAWVVLCGLFLAISRDIHASPEQTPAAPQVNSYDALVEFFLAWREFQSPPLVDGAPDYSKEGMARQHRELAEWRRRLESIDRAGWTISQQVDWYIIRAEMNGMDFDHRVFRPWERDPAYYVWFRPSGTDVPAREAPSMPGSIEMSEYRGALSAADAAKLAESLRGVPALYRQARVNLIGNCRDLWVHGTRMVGGQSRSLSSFARSVEAEYPELAAAAAAAGEASDQLAQWLDEQAPSKTGPSGIGKENYTWYLRNVHLVPYSYEDEELLMKRELARSLATLRLQEHNNRGLGPHAKIEDAEEFNRLAQRGVADYMKFLGEDEIVTIKEYMEPAIRARMPRFRGGRGGLRSFFDELTYRDPMIMRTHDYHYIELARIREEPHPNAIRRLAPLYNIWMGRAEGFATAFEEMMLHAGMFDDRPRAKELISILIADRAARGLGGLYQHGLEMDLQQAAEFTSKWVPWGLMPADSGLIQSEQLLYLRQPGYGTCYLTGKLQIDALIAEYARTREGEFKLKELMDKINGAGFPPLSLLHWELTGDKSMLEAAIGKH